MLELYHAPGSCALASLVCLYETGAPFTARRLALADGEQRSEWYRAMAPHGRVPLLVVDGTPVSETIAILSYIAARFPEAQLLPADPLARSRAYEFMSWIASSVHATIGQLWRSERFVDDEAGAASLKAGAPARLDAAFVEINGRIVGPWAMPEGYSAVDPYLGVVYRWAVRLGTDMNRFPRWQAHNARLLERPAVQQALAAEKAEENEVINA